MTRRITPKKDRNISIYARKDIISPLLPLGVINGSQIVFNQ